MRQQFTRDCPECQKVGASLGKAEVFVRAAPYFIGMRIVLPIVVPIAHRANTVVVALGERSISTAWAGSLCGRVHVPLNEN